MLWGRAANRCAFPDCRLELVMDVSETDDSSLVGEECHMVARELKGPRGDSPLTEERDRYHNLILLCNVHHKLIDDHPQTYTIEVLKNMKLEHEQWVNKSLDSFDSTKQRDEELCAMYVQEWIQLVELDQWQNWASLALKYGQPTLSKHMDEKLSQLGNWTISRVWPKHYLKLENIFRNFQMVLQDFLYILHLHSVESGNIYYTRKFYRNDNEWTDNYHELTRRYEFHVDLVQDLMLELTRAANYICDQVRHVIDPTFRLREGAVIVESGPNSLMRFALLKVEYLEEERTDSPYPGLESFKTDRLKRDRHFGG